MDANPGPPKAPTLEHVARRAGVSRATVSRVINNVRNVDPRLAEAVREAVEATGYVPSHVARSLATRRTDSVALVVSEGEHRTVPAAGPFVGRVFTDPFFGRMVEGLSTVLQPRGVNLAVMFVETDAMRRQLLGYLRQGHVDGVLLVSSHAQDPLPRMLGESGLPTVLSEKPVSDLRISCVDSPNREGAKLAADHLAALGRRRLACISGPLDMVAGRDRLEGFREAMALHGRLRIPSVEGGFTQGSGSAAMSRLLDEHPDIDGVFAANDLMALGAVAVLRERGRRIPDDVAVVGFDDSQAALLCRPPLTTVHLPVEEMAAEMARLLLARIDRPDLPEETSVFVPSLVVRESA